MIGTAYANDHTLWGQIVKKENDVKARYEYLTGETSAKKFYNGSNSVNVDSKLQTFSKERMPAHMKALAATMNSAGKPLNKRSSQSSLGGGVTSKSGGRYSTASKGDVLSHALEQVLSEKRSKASGT